MNLPEIKAYEEQAIDTVVSVINRATEKIGTRLNLFQLALSRKNLASHVKVSLGSIGTPLPITSERFIGKTIERVWKLTDAFMYTLKYLGGSQDECSQFYYFEAIFSQPCTAYPIPQATVSVFFRIEDKHIEPLEIRGVSRMWFRIEGQQVDHDVQFVALTADWILAVLQMKMKLFQRIEKIQLF